MDRPRKQTSQAIEARLLAACENHEITYREGGRGGMQYRWWLSETEGRVLSSAERRHLVRLIGEGRTTDEMAALLRLSPRTVEFHRAKVREALGISSDRALLRFALMVRIGRDEEPAA